VLINVEASGINDVQAVTLRAEDGATRRFVIGSEISRTGHPPSSGHLRQHMAFGDRVTIVYRESADGPVAIEIRDQ
jgi:hypothetical protein